MVALYAMPDRAESVGALNYLGAPVSGHGSTSVLALDQRRFGERVIQRGRLRAARVTLSGDATSDASVAVCFLSRGNVSIDLGCGTGSCFSPGDSFYLTSWTRYSVEWPQDTAGYLIIVPLAALEAYGAHVDAQMTAFAPSSALGPAARGFISHVFDTEQPGWLTGLSIAHLTDQMIASLFLETALNPKNGQSGRPTLFLQALSVITADASMTELSPTRVANNLFVSVRALQRCFHVHSTTISSEIRRRRLELASTLLCDRSAAPLPLSTIAAHSGFKNVAELRRALRSEQQPTPKMIRDQPPSTPPGHTKLAS